MHYSVHIQQGSKCAVLPYFVERYQKKWLTPCVGKGTISKDSLKLHENLLNTRSCFSMSATITDTDRPNINKVIKYLLLFIFLKKFCLARKQKKKVTSLDGM